MSEEAVQDQTPQHSQAFGAAEDADATRQAQHQMGNDFPIDVNPNAVIARAQCETITQMGKNFEAQAMRFNGLMGHMAAKMAGT
jgi:hypothetical protein